MERTTQTPAIKPVTQQRSQRTLRRIIDAFATLLHTKTFEEVTVAEICRVAGCSVGSFYGRVASKDDLLGHLCDRSYDELAKVVAAVVEPTQYGALGFREVLERQVRALTILHVERRGVLRAMIVHARRREAFGAATRAFNERLVRVVAEAWRRHLERSKLSVGSRSLETAAVMAAAFLRESLIFGELWPTLRDTDEAQIGADLTDMLTNYLSPVDGMDRETGAHTT